MNAAERILVVDNNRIILMGFEQVLKQAGFEVSTAANTRDAKELLGTKPFDLVLTDLALQDESGLAILQKTKEITPEPVVIIITASASLQSTIEVLQHGAFDYIIKPCDDEELLIRIRRGLERKRMLQEIREKKIQEERLKAITQTAVTVNDQINTPLNVILSSSEYLREKITKKDPSIIESLEYIVREVANIKKVVSRLAQIIDPQITEYAFKDMTMVDLDHSRVQSESPDLPEQSKVLGDEQPTYSILVVDNEITILTSLSKLLAMLGYKTVTAENGQAALSVLELDPIDLVITDVNMPGMSGIELLRQIKLKNQELPVIVMTGFEIAEVPATAQANKADGFLPKPFLMNDMKNLINRVLVKSRSGEMNNKSPRMDERLDTGLFDKLGFRAQNDSSTN
jgi:DNA-binding NtrC family response regulator